MSSKNARQPSINKNQPNKSVTKPVKPTVAKTPQIPVTINKIQVAKETAKAKNQLDKMRPPNKILPDTKIFNYGTSTPVNTIKALVNKLEEKAKAPDLPPLESPMGKQDDEALEEFEHPVINEKEKYEKNADLPVIEISIEETKVNIDSTVITKCEPLNIIIGQEQEPSLTSQLDNDDIKINTNQQSKQDTLRDRTESEEELIKETVMLFLSDDNEETSDYGILPGQIVEETVRNKIEAIGRKEKAFSPAMSEIKVNKGLMTIITENMIVKVSTSKLIGYIAGGRSESVILIFKKNNITVPIKNKDTFKTIIVSLDEILSKRSRCFPFFSFY